MAEIKKIFVNGKDEVEFFKQLEREVAKQIRRSQPLLMK